MLARRNLATAFRTHIINARDSDNVASLTPVRILGSCSFLYMRSSDVYLLAVTKSNANAMLAFQFMTNVRTSWLCCDLQHFTSLAKLSPPTLPAKVPLPLGIQPACESARLHCKLA